MKSNVEAEALSHIPRASDILTDSPSVKAIISTVPYTNHTDYNFHHSNPVCKSTQIVVHKMFRDDWKTEQENDSIIGPVINVIQSKEFNKDVFNDESKRLLHSQSRLLFRCGLLYRKVFDGQLQENKFQFIIPQLYWKQALEACHKNMGHLGIERQQPCLKIIFTGLPLPRMW